MHYRTLVRIPKHIDEDNHEGYLEEVMKDFNEENDDRYVVLSSPDWGPWIPKHLAMDMSKDAIPNIIKLMTSNQHEHPVTVAETGKEEWSCIWRAEPIIIDDIENIYDKDKQIKRYYAEEWPHHFMARWIIPIDSETGELFSPLRIEDNGCWDWYVEGGRWHKDEKADQYEADLAGNRERWGKYRAEKMKSKDDERLQRRWKAIQKAHKHYLDKDDKDVKEYLDMINHASLDLMHKYRTELLHPGYKKLCKLAQAEDKEVFEWSTMEDIHYRNEADFFEHHAYRSLFAPFVFEAGKVGKFDSYYWNHQPHCHIHWNTRLMAFRMWVDKWDDDDWVVTVDIHN